MTARRTIVVVDQFYEDPLAIRDYALRQAYYTPYETDADVAAGDATPTWWASHCRPADDCPFKSSSALIDSLQEAVDEPIDLDHWRTQFPLDACGKPSRLTHDAGACVWNCCFHVKPNNGQRLGDGVHNHVVDSWNSVGPHGWAGLIYLNPIAPRDGGLYLWRNTDPARQFDWMTPANHWELVDSFGNIFNRLILVRGDIPHSGACGWGSRIDDGRLYQTFFFRTMRQRHIHPVSIPAAGG